MNGFNLSDITDAKLGATTLGSIYLGSTKLWPLGTDYSKIEFTIESLEDNNTVRLESKSSPNSFEVAISTNGGSTYATVLWGSVYGNKTLNTGDTLKIRPVTGGYLNNSTSAYHHITAMKNIKVYGNINSIMDNQWKTRNLNYTTDYQLACLFKGCTTLIDASDLVLPSTPGRYSYVSMFEGCTGLVYPPKTLAGTEVGYYGCYYMFKGCSSLIDVPDLPATTLAGYAYAGMFQNCTSLTVLPKLNHITTITYWAPFRYTFSGCTSIEDARWDKYGGRLLPDRLTVTSGGSAYELMFQSCTGLKYAPELTETSPHTGEYNTMFQNCTSLYILITHATSLGSNYFNNIVKGTGRRGAVRKASDVTWDSAQYTQFTYSGSGSSALMWLVSTGDYTSGDYQT